MSNFQSGRYESLPFTPDEMFIKSTPVDLHEVPEEQLHGYEGWTLDRSISYLQADSWAIDGREGVIQTFRNLYQKEGRISVLDAGCGTGRTLWELVSHNGVIAGVNWGNVAADAISDHDFSRLSEHWRVRAAIMTGDINYELGDLTAMTLPSEAYDLVYSYELLPHLQKPQLVVDSLWRALRPGGVLYFNARDEQRENMAEATLSIKENGGTVLSAPCDPGERARCNAREYGELLPARDIYKATKA